MPEPSTFQQLEGDIADIVGRGAGHVIPVRNRTIMEDLDALNKTIEELRTSVTELRQRIINTVGHTTPRGR